MLCRVLAVGATLLKHASVFVSSHAGLSELLQGKGAGKAGRYQGKPTVW